MNTILENYNKIKDKIKDYPDTEIVTELNMYNLEDCKKIAESGIKKVSVNRRETFMERYNALKDYNLEWHFSGSLTTYSSMNTQFIDSIDIYESLESFDVAGVINRVRKKEEPLNCFIKVDLCDEKGPILPNKVVTFVKQLKRFPKIRVIGLMCVTKITYDTDLLKSWYHKLNELRTKVQKLELDYAPCTYLSMGTSSDCLVACSEGSNFIKVSKIF